MGFNFQSCCLALKLEVSGNFNSSLNYSVLVDNILHIIL